MQDVVTFPSAPAESAVPHLCPWLPWLLGLHAALFLGIGLVAVCRPQAFAYDELQIANLAWFWRHGIVPYFGHDALPAVFNPYGPCYPWLLGRVAALGGNVFMAGRVVSWLAISACLAAVVVAPRAGRRGGIWLFASAVLLLTARTAFTFAMRCRTDAFAVALAVVGYLLTTRGRQRWHLALGTGLLALSTLTKITSVAAPVAAFLALRRGRRDDAWVVLLGWAGLAGAGYGLLDVLSGGQLLGSLARTPGHLGRALEMASRPFTLTGLWVLATVVGVQCLPRRERTGLGDLAWYGGLSYAVAVVTGGAWGSHWGYLLEFFVVLAVAFATITTRLAARDDRWALRHMSWLLAGHLVVAVPYLTCTGLRYLREGACLASQVPEARRRLAPRLAAGERVAVIHSPAAASVLVGLDRPNLIDVVDLRPTDPEAEAQVVRRTLAAGLVDVVLVGVELRPWEPAPDWTAPAQQVPSAALGLHLAGSGRGADHAR